MSEKGPYRYIIFGLRMATDLVFPECLIDHSGDDDADITIFEGGVPDTIPDAYPLRFPEIRQASATAMRLNIKSVATFYIHDGTTITYSPYEEVTLDELRLFILGTCISALLHQRGLIVLHGNTVSEDGKTCTVYVGNCGAGKSTLAAQCYQKGQYILTDDISVITFDTDGTPIVIPSFPQLKLWQDSADLLSIDTSTLRQVRPQDKKFAIIVGDQFFNKPLPISRIIELHRPSVEVKNILGVEKLQFLIRNTYRYPYVKMMRKTPEYLAQLLKLSQQCHLQKQV